METSTVSLPRRLLWVLYMAIFMAALDGSIVGPVLNTLRDTFGASERDLSWAVNMYVLTSLIAMPLMAGLSDLYGRRRVFILDIVLFAVGSAVIVVAPSYSLVLVGRGIQGLGAGGLMPVSVAMIGDEVPREKQGTALGFMGMISGLSFIIGPLLGGVLLQWSWRLLFTINLPIAALIVVLAMGALPKAQARKSGSLDWPGLALLSVALGALALGINRIDLAHWKESLADIEVWGLLALAVVLLPLFYLVERRAPQPIVNPRVFGSSTLIVTNLLAFGAGIGMVSVLFVPAIAKLALHIDDSQASFMLLPAILTFVAASPLAGSLLPKIGSRTVLQIGGVILTASMFGFSQGAEQTWSFYVTTIFVGIGLATMSNLPLRYIVNNEAPASDRASAQAVLLVFQTTGQLVSAALIGALAESLGTGAEGYLDAFIVLGCIAAVMTVMTVGLKNREAERRAMAARTG